MQVGTRVRLPDMQNGVISKVLATGNVVVTTDGGNEVGAEPRQLQLVESDLTDADLDAIGDEGDEADESGASTDDLDTKGDADEGEDRETDDQESLEENPEI